MKNTFISVIIPVYNAAAYLPRCLESILAVGISDMEILLVDDGSRDQSGEICRRYTEQYSFVRYLPQENRGPSTARNNGLDNARGEYIAFFDSDDYIDPVSFRRVTERLRGSGAEIWASDFQRVADNGCVLDRVWQIPESAEPLEGKSMLLDFLRAKDCVWNVWRYLFRRDFLEKHQLRFAEGYHIAEDLELVVRAINSCERMLFWHEPYYSYRVNYGESLTRSYSAARVCQLMTMLQRAMESLGEGEAAAALKAKLAREYILNLSLMWEVKAAERHEACEALSAVSLAQEAVGVYALAAKAVKLLGVPFCALGLYCLKRGKRLIRAMKTRRYAGR